MAKYVLLTVCERNITWDIFESFEEARESMINMLKDEYDDRFEPEYLKYEWDNIIKEYEESSAVDCSKHVEYDGVGLYYDSAWYYESAWSNIYYCIDWQIIEVNNCP